MLRVTGLQGARAGGGRQRWPQNSVIAGPEKAPSRRLNLIRDAVGCLGPTGRSHIAVMAGMPRQALAPHDDPFPHEFELERIQPSREMAPDHWASRNGFELVPGASILMARTIRSPMARMTIAQPPPGTGGHCSAHQSFGGVVESRCDKLRHLSAEAFTTRECGVALGMAAPTAHTARPALRRRADPPTK
jgi:hypothetical protein